MQQSSGTGENGFPRLSRRAWLRLAALGGGAFAAGDAFALEPRWLRVRTLCLSDAPRARIAHFTDIHFKGDDAYLARVVGAINALEADSACFTGDIVEDASFLEGALAHLRRVACPLFGVPGNHDYWSGAPFPSIARAFESTGGGWLLDESVRVGDVRISGAAKEEPGPPPDPSVPVNIHLGHYPATVNRMEMRRYGLLLAGHSHGGQVRMPLYGALVVPYNVGRYDLGLFQTPAGPLYVNPGIGTWKYPVRFCCRPEVTLFEV